MFVAGLHRGLSGSRDVQVIGMEKVNCGLVVGWRFFPLVGAFYPPSGMITGVWSSPPSFDFGHLQDSTASGKGLQVMVFTLSVSVGGTFGSFFPGPSATSAQGQHPKGSKAGRARMCG